MITKNKVEKAGYRVLPKGGYVRLDRELIKDWFNFCGKFDVDPECEEIVFCVCGVKEIFEGEINDIR